MSDETLRRMDLTQIGEGRYKAVNVRGGVLPIGSGDDPDFTPVELLLASLAGLSVGLITGRRARPEGLEVHVEGHKVRDDGGSAPGGPGQRHRLHPLPGGGGRRPGARGAAPRDPPDRTGCARSARTLQLGTTIEYAEA